MKFRSDRARQRCLQIDRREEREEKGRLLMGEPTDPADALELWPIGQHGAPVFLEDLFESPKVRVLLTCGHYHGPIHPVPHEGETHWFTDPGRPVWCGWCKHKAQMDLAFQAFLYE